MKSQHTPREPKQKRGAPPVRSPLPPMRELVMSAVPFALLLILRGAGMFVPELRAWGINQLAFLPTTWSLSFLLFGCILCTPVLYRGYAGMAGWMFPQTPSTSVWIRPFLLSVLAAVLFWLLRMETYFLGDGAVYLAEHYRYARGLPVSESVLFSGVSAPVTARILAYSAKFLYSFTAPGDTFFIDPKLTFRLWGAIAGVAFVLISWHGVRQLLQRPEERFAFFIMLVSSAGVLFYFGYVEYYTFAFTAMTLYFIVLHRAVDGSVPVYVPGVVLLVAMGFHFMAVVAIPSLFLLIAVRAKRERMRNLVSLKPVAVITACLLIAGGIYYFLSGVYAHGHRVILSLLPFGKEGAIQSYTLLSSYHLIDMVNYLLLLGGPTIIGCVLLLRRGSFSSPHVVIAFVNVTFFLFLTFFGNMGFGMARDWDINAVLGLALLFLLFALYREGDAIRNVRYRIYLLAGSAAAAGVIWFGVNIHPEASVQRFRSIMALDEHHIAGDYALNGYEHVRKYYFSKNDTKGVMWAVRKKIECVGYPEDIRRYVQTTVQSSPSGEKQEQFSWVFDHLFHRLEEMNRKHLDSVYAGTRASFSEILVETMLNYYYANFSKGTDNPFLKDIMRRAERTLPGNPVLAMVKAQLAWDLTGAVADADVFVRGGEAIQTSSVLCLYAGRALVFVRQYDRAIPVLEKSIRLDSTFTLPLLYLTVSDIQLNPSGYNREKAVSALERFLADPEGRRLAASKETDAQLVQYATNLLRYIQGTPNS